MSSADTDFGAFSRDFERKILRPRKIFENFGPTSPAISRAVACRGSAQCCCTFEGRHKAANLRQTRIMARSRAISNEKFCGRVQNLKISVRHRPQSHAPQHADAPHSANGPFRVVTRLQIFGRHGFRRVLPRSRTKNYAAAKTFRKLRPDIARNLTRRSIPTLRTVLMDL